MGSGRTKPMAYRDTVAALTIPDLLGGCHGAHCDLAGREQTKRQSTGMAHGLQRTNEERIEALALIVEAREQYKVGHHRRVADLACAIACEMGRMPELGHTIRTAALVHDVGKICVPVQVLTRPGLLTRYEFVSITHHSGAGYEILNSFRCARPIADVVLQHHERMDGSGYPSGLKGDSIRLEARILGVADVVEAMIHPRCYRPALGMDKALQKIAGDKGILYDREVVEACLSVLLDRGFKFR